MTCDDLAKKCKAGDKKACEMYKKKCGKVKTFIHFLIKAYECLELEDVFGNILEGEGDQKYPGIDLDLEVNLKYLDCVLSNMEKSISVNLIPIGLSKYPSEAPRETIGKNL